MPLDEEQDPKFDYDEEVDSKHNYSEDQPNNQNEFEEDGEELVPGINEMQNEDDSDNAHEEQDELELGQNQQQFQNNAFGQPPLPVPMNEARRIRP